MLDYVIRNARVPGAANGGAVDIGFSKGKIAAIEPKLVADSPSYDAQGCLCCGGLVETHIHLDKSRIIDRCTPEPQPRAIPNHMRRVQAVKPGFTRRGHLQSRQDHAGELHQAGHHAHPHPRRDRSCRSAPSASRR